MIPESTIEKVLEQFENQEVDFEKAIQEFGGRQPAVLSFLMSGNEGVFSEDEQDFMLYLAVVIFKSVEAANGEPPKITPEEIADAEEANWSVMAESKGKMFRDRLDPFFENSPEEELLAFVEDALDMEAEDEFGETFSLTPEGQEPMFVMLKTVIDVLTAE